MGVEEIQNKQLIVRYNVIFKIIILASIVKWIFSCESDEPMMTCQLQKIIIDTKINIMPVMTTTVCHSRYWWSLSVRGT